MQLLSLNADALISSGFPLTGKFHCRILNVVLELLAQHLLLLKLTTTLPISFSTFFQLIHLLFLQLPVFPHLHPVLFNLMLVQLTLLPKTFMLIFKWVLLNFYLIWNPLQFQSPPPNLFIHCYDHLSFFFRTLSNSNLSLLISSFSLMSIWC